MNRNQSAGHGIPSAVSPNEKVSKLLHVKILGATHYYFFTMFSGSVTSEKLCGMIKTINTQVRHSNT